MTSPDDKPEKLGWFHSSGPVAIYAAVALAFIAFILLSVLIKGIQVVATVFGIPSYLRLLLQGISCIYAMSLVVETFLKAILLPGDPAFLGMGLVKATNNPLIRHLLPVPPNPLERPERSVIGIMRDKRASQTLVATSVLASGLLVYIGLCVSSRHPMSPYVIWSMSAVLVGTIAQKAVFDFRVLRGHFGNNELEAREIVQFIISSAARLGTDDGNGPTGVFVSACPLETGKTTIDWRETAVVEAQTHGH